MLKVYTKREGDIAILCLQGGIVTGETATLRDAVLSQSEADAMVIDLARVSRIDAGGLGVLLELREQTRVQGKEFKLRNVNRLIRQVLEVTRLNSVFEISQESRAPALNPQGRSAIVFETATCA